MNGETKHSDEIIHLHKGLFFAATVCRAIPAFVSSSLHPAVMMSGRSHAWCCYNLSFLVLL